MDGFVVGVSGGIDSAVTSTLCAKTENKVLCLEMPICQDSNQNNRAKNHIDWLKKEYNSEILNSSFKRRVEWKRAAIDLMEFSNAKNQY